MRVHYASHEDAQLVRGMNRLRHAYLDIDPGIEPYLVAGHTDDVAGIDQTYTMGPSRNATQLLASASLFITGVTALVAGGWVGILVVPAGTALAVALGALAGLAYVARVPVRRLPRSTSCTSKAPGTGPLPDPGRRGSVRLTDQLGHHLLERGEPALARPARRTPSSMRSSAAYTSRMKRSPAAVRNTSRTRPSAGSGEVLR